jgi:hypothetical protein
MGSGLAGEARAPECPDEMIGRLHPGWRMPSFGVLRAASEMVSQN